MKKFVTDFEIEIVKQFGELSSIKYITSREVLL